MKLYKISNIDMVKIASNVALWKGVAFIVMLSVVAYEVAEMSVVKSLSLSPMIVGIVLGMLYANSLSRYQPESWGTGIRFSAKRILRVGIILYGFRLTFADVMGMGWQVLVIDMVIVIGTILGGLLLGRLLRMDREVALLTSVGSGICGAAAVLGAEAALKVQPYKTAVAVSTVVIFGTLSMFLYPLLFRQGLFALSPEAMGVLTGATVHEVAHVVGAGNAIGGATADVAIVVKMMRVMLLVPVLFVLAYVAGKRSIQRMAKGEAEKCQVVVPWFAVGFLLVIGFNTLDILPEEMVASINKADTFLLTMAMTALGVETSIDKFRKAGAKPFLLAALLFGWLVVGGYVLVKYVFPVG